MRVDTKKFKGKLEPQVYKGLRSFAGPNKFTIEYESEELEYKIVRVYIPDFVLEFKDGRKIYIEAKGWLRPDDRDKLIAVKRDHPELDIRIIFQADNKLNKRARMRYSDWAAKHGFPFAVGEIPKEWFE
jgi:predicted nuclease of restriction endonuclease-like RecB superfamily